MEVETLNKKRIEELDMIKGFSICLVCLHHINEMTGLTAIGGDIYKALFTFSESIMILFFICSGYVYSPKGTILQDILKKIKQLLIPLAKFELLNIAIYFVRYIIIDKKPFIWFLDNTITNVLGFTNWNVRLGEVVPNVMEYAFVPYWFVLQLIVAFCIFIPIKRLTDNKHISIQIIATAVLIGVAMTLNYFDLQNTLKDTFNSSVPFCFVLINVFGFAAVLMIGSMLKKINLYDLDSHKMSYNLIALSISLVCFSILAIIYENNGYALQYGGWGPYGFLSIPITTIGGVMITYILVFIAHYLKKITIIKTVFTCLGTRSLYIFMLHFAVAETICWIGGFWHDIYHQGFPVEDFNFFNWLITIVGTIIILVIYFIVKSKLTQKKAVK